MLFSCTRRGSPADEPVLAGAATAGDDRGYGPLERIARTRSLALDLDIGCRDSCVRLGQAFGRPPAKLATRLVDLPWRQTELAS
jgi:hypothetical protein